MLINYIQRFTNRVADKCLFEITKRPLGSIDRMRNCSHILLNIFAKQISVFLYTREKGTNLQSLSQTNRWSFQFKIHPSTGKKREEFRWCFFFFCPVWKSTKSQQTYRASAGWQNESGFLETAWWCSLKSWWKFPYALFLFVCLVLFKRKYHN